MSGTTVGIVDYGMGNHASVIQSLRDIGYRVRVSADPVILDSTDLLVIPGVGAFPAAMTALNRLGLVRYLQKQARELKPMIGICLGMQLFATASHEFEYTAGLNIIPGEVLPMTDAKWHIGWNTLECIKAGTTIQQSDGKEFYFNHSFYFKGPIEYQIAVSRHSDSFAAVIGRGKVVGVQFHPEKSQRAGRELLNNLIRELVISA